MATFEITQNDASQQSTLLIRLLFIDSDPITITEVQPERLCSQDPAHGLTALAARLVDRLESQAESLDRQLAGSDFSQREAFWMLFSDPYLMKADGSHLFLEIDTKVSYRTRNAAFFSLSAAFYKGIFLFLNNDERYNTREAWLASLYAAWQWYQLTKILLVVSSSEPADPAARPTNTHAEREALKRLQENWQAGLRRELDSAYRYLVTLLNDPRYAQAIRWLANWSHAVEEGYGSGPLLREQLRLSLPLWEDRDLEKVNPCIPIPAPGCLDQIRPNWQQTRLHPAFAQSPRDRIVRQTITEWLLPRYDFSNAFWLAMLLKKNRAGINSLWIYWFGGLWAFLPALVITIGSFALRGWPLADWQDGLGTVAFLQIVLGFGIPALLALSKMEMRVLANFMLPRVIGGVFIGYLTLALQNDSITVSNAIWSRGPLLVVALWVAVVLVGYSYLYFDTRPLVKDEGTAHGRAAWSLVMAVIISLLAGLLSVAITSAAYQIQAPCSAFYELSGCKVVGTFLGPFGWIDISQYLIFVPVALFTGLVTQFVFEELTLPASVWSPEQE